MLAALFLILAAATPPAHKATVRSADGVPIHYEVRGAGEPTLVFVHGWAMDGTLWERQVTELSRWERVVTLDLAGHGQSGKDRADWSIAAFGADVKAVVDDLGADQVILIGHSMGGPVVLEAGRRTPDSLVGIVLVDTLLDVTQKTPPEEIEAFAGQLQADYKAAAAQMSEGFLFAPKTPPAVRKRVLDAALALPANSSIAMLRSAWSYDPLPALAQIKVPIRAVNADKYPTNVEANRKAMPGFEVSLVKGSGHYPMLEDPKRFSAAFTEAVDRVVNSQSLPGEALVGEGASKRRYAVHGISAPTVVFEAGFGNGMGTWKPVFARVGEFARVFAYDRPGYGGSSVGAMPRMPQQVVEDLRDLLYRAGVAPPYILVGHSLGGIYVEWFARHHREEVAGLVLEDARHSQVTQKCLARRMQECSPSATELAELNPTMRSEITQMNKYPNVSVPKGLEDLPVTVLTGARRSGTTPNDLAWLKLWGETQRSLASESARRRQVVFSDSGHYVHVDQRDAFVDALRDMVRRAAPARSSK
jgi:pimeloyl-ACP methyl ester carboxylesterase